MLIRLLHAVFQKSFKNSVSWVAAASVYPWPLQGLPFSCLPPAQPLSAFEPVTTLWCIAESPARVKSTLGLGRATVSQGWVRADRLALVSRSVHAVQCVVSATRGPLHQRSDARVFSREYVLAFDGNSRLFPQPGLVHVPAHIPGYKGKIIDPCHRWLTADPPMLERAVQAGTVRLAGPLTQALFREGFPDECRTRSPHMGWDRPPVSPSWFPAFDRVWISLLVHSLIYLNEVSFPAAAWMTCGSDPRSPETPARAVKDGETQDPEPPYAWTVGSDSSEGSSDLSG